MRLPPPLRRALNQLIDNELTRCKVVLGDVDPRPRAWRQLKKTLQTDPFYNSFLEFIVERLLDDYLKGEVHKRIDKARQEYVPKESNEYCQDIPAIAHSDTRQPVWIKPPGPGGKPTPKLMTEAGDRDHIRIAERREQQGLLLLRKSRWHKDVVDWADRHGLSEHIVQELFEIDASENGSGDDE